MPAYAISHCDVFTSHIGAGNPLAVILDAEGISDADMQHIAYRLNLAETTYVLPATTPNVEGEGGICRMVLRGDLQ